MKPVYHAGCNFTYFGPKPDIGDLHVQIQENGCVEVVYELDDEERDMIAQGGKIRLGIYSRPIPPVSMAVTPAGMYEPIAEHGFKEIPELREREEGHDPTDPR
jgi:hypothetical protein